VAVARTRLPAAAASDPGRAREINEDRVLCDTERGIFAVVDGVGGESAGEIAAQTALDVLRARLSRRTTDLGRLVREAVALANKQIYERAEGDPSLAGMSCVLTVAVLDGTQATVGHVGDSRLYRLRRGEIEKITRDHSPVGAREDAGEISEAEAMRHPRRNEIFRDVGSEPHEPEDEGFVDILQIAFEPESALLLCSDGLSDLVASQDIRTIVEANAADPGAAAQALIDRANAAGGKDNISVVLVQGERYAASLRNRTAEPATATAETRRTVPLRGAAAARSASGSRLGRILGSRPMVFLYGAVLTLLVTGLLLDRRLVGIDIPGLGGGEEVLRVGVGDGGLATIGEALAKARPGTTIEVAPGEYAERIQLRSGIALVSLVPRGAVLRPAGAGGPAVTAQGVRGARLQGFRVAGEGLAVGVRLADSDVEIEGLEVSGATVAGVEIAGADRSTLRVSFVHDNPGSGVIAAGEAAPVLLHNLILRNGARPGAPRPGVEVRDAARPALVENRIEGNGGGGIALAAPGREEEYLRWNSFGGAARGQAVRGPLAPPPTVAPVPAPAPGRPR